jgi:hypothetical protein
MLNCYYVIFYAKADGHCGRAIVFAESRHEAQTLVRKEVNYDIDDEMHIHTKNYDKPTVLQITHPDGYGDNF